jgi:hypothetical protein
MKQNSKLNSVAFVKSHILKIYLAALSLACLPLTGQNMASIEVPSGISFVYGFDYHPKWYTQLKPTLGFAWAGGHFLGESNSRKELRYAFIVEQRYYYNMLNRQIKGKNTLNKSADFFSVKPAYTYTRVSSENIFGMYEYGYHTYYCTVNWGMRRAMGKRFYFDGSIGIGPGYHSHVRTMEAVFDLNLSIGFKLF